jgi:hypothetical protein
MYKDADEQKMHFGPLWDLDLGYDNSSERSLQHNMSAYLGLWNRPFEKILQRLWLDPWFAQACNDRLNEWINHGLQSYLIENIDSLRNAIWQSQRENYKVWPINKQVYDWEKHSYYTTYDGYINELKSFVNNHIPYLQQAFANRLSSGIHDIMANQEASDQIYDLQGRRVGKDNMKGIYIQNHHKIIRQ